jgi:protein-S-isoprenylcysteine O-methyltransferase Ste14
VTHLLTALVLLVAPLAEEPWLEEQYGQAYLGYRRTTPRYL